MAPVSVQPPDRDDFGAVAGLNDRRQRTIGADDFEALPRALIDGMCRAPIARLELANVEGGTEFGLPETHIRKLLADARLRPTRQRMLLATLLFGRGDRHVTAEGLHAEVLASGAHVSLATVYNALHQFKDAGLLRELALEGTKAYFDTNTSNHNHFYIENEGRLMDIPGEGVRVAGVPEPPEGLAVSHIDVVVRLVRK